MKAHADRVVHRHDKSVTQTPGQRTSPASALWFEDNRLETQRHGALQTIADNSRHAKRFRRQQSPVTSSPPVRPPAIQRKLQIGADKASLKAIEGWRDVAAFLSAHGHHFYYGFKSVIEFDFDNKDLVYVGAEGAKDLSAALLQAMNKGFKEKAKTQDEVQRKLVEVCELVRVSRAHAQALKDDIETTDWYYNAILNGLCLGFTEIFKEHADWEMALWNSIVLWKPVAGDSATALKALNEHLNTTINWSHGQVTRRALEGTLLLKEAWQRMNSGEEGSYEPVPAWLNDLTGAEAGTRLVQMGQMTRRITSPPEASAFIVKAGKLVESDSATIKDTVYIVEISTPGHSMMARFRKGQPIDILESEETGLVQAGTWEGAAEVLWNGIVIGYKGKEKAGIPLDIDVKRMVPLLDATEDVERDMFASLEVESLETFKGVSEGSDAEQFLSDVNPGLWDKVFGKEKT